MASGSENSEDSHLGKKVQTNDQKEELPMDDHENIIEKEKVKGGGSNDEGKIEDERKPDEGRKNGEEKKEALSKIDAGMEIDEAKKGDVKEINEMKSDGDVTVINEMKNDIEAKKGDVKEINEMKNDEAKEGDVKVINEMKNDIEAKKGDAKEINEMKNDEAKEGDVKVINEMKNDIEAEKGDGKAINEVKNDEAKKGDVKVINEILKIDETKKENEGKINEMNTSEAIREEDKKKIKEIDISVVEKEDEVVKGGEAKEKDENNEAKAIQEKQISEDVKERVVKIDQNPKFAEENSELNKNEKKNDVEGDDVSSCNVVVSRLSFKEESNLFSDLKENEKKALVELRSKVEEAINGNQLFKAKEMEKPKENEGKEDARDDGSKENSSCIDEPEKEKDKNGKESEEKSLKVVKDDMEEVRNVMQEGMEKERVIAEAEEKKMQEAIEGKEDYIDKDKKLWGVPLLPSKGGNATDAMLLKFLRARDFKVIDAFEMLRNTLQWRKENNMDSILDEDLGNDFHSTAYMNGSDRQGHPVCYNVFGVFGHDEMYNKTLGTEENREKFLRWRLRLMEEGIEKLDFNGVSSLLQINDLKNTPGPSKKEVRLFMKQVVSLLQDNYPEFVVKNIFINVPFWYYAFAALLSPFLTQRTKSKFVYARPAKVIETLLKYINAEEIPVCYGGLKRDNDSDFFDEDHAEEILVKASSTETIEIPAPEAGSVLIWDLVVLGWEVNYKEEFIPDDEKSYTIIVQKEKKMGIQEGSIRNSFRNNEPGKIVLIIGNAAFKNKKRAFYRYKIKNSSST
ncbi:hypothetical protein CRYUN_Cryun26dG0126400 [Craigia yunnanensis]